MKYALLLLLTSQAFAVPDDEVRVTLDDIYRPTVEILAELREAGEDAEIEIEHLTKQSCTNLADNIEASGTRLNKINFIRGCKGKGVSILQQAEAPEMPLFINLAIVTYVNYGNIPYAVENPKAFFGNGNFYFPGIIARSKDKACALLHVVQDEKVELATRYMIGDLLVYDVRVTYKAMGIVSVRYFLDDDVESLPWYPTRYDFNFWCD